MVRKIMQQNSPAKAGAKLKGDCSNSKMISLYYSDWLQLLSLWAGIFLSGEAVSSGKAVTDMWMAPVEGSLTPPPLSRAGVVWIEERRSLNLGFSFFSVNHSSHLYFLGANCHQTIHNLSRVRTLTASKQPPLCHLFSVILTSCETPV